MGEAKFLKVHRVIIPQICVSILKQRHIMGGRENCSSIRELAAKMLMFHAFDRGHENVYH